MSQPTGYKPGRPRKGEIRPTTKGGLASYEWYYSDHEHAKKLNREKMRRYRTEDPERMANYNKTARLRRIGWGDTIITVNGSNHIEVCSETIDIRVQVDG